MEYIGYLMNKKTTREDLMVFQYGTTAEPEMVVTKRKNLTKKQREAIMQENTFRELENGTNATGTNKPTTRKNHRAGEKTKVLKQFANKQRNGVK